MRDFDLGWQRSSTTQAGPAVVAERNAAATIQNLGGVGYTWDRGAHLYVTRALLQRRLVLGPARSLDLAADEPAPAG